MELYSRTWGSKDGLDEPNGFINGKEPFGYHPEMGGYPDLYNHLLACERMVTFHTVLKFFIGHVLAGAVIILGTLLVTFVCYVFGLATASQGY